MYTEEQLQEVVTYLTEENNVKLMAVMMVIKKVIKENTDPEVCEKIHNAVSEALIKLDEHEKDDDDSPAALTVV